MVSKKYRSKIVHFKKPLLLSAYGVIFAIIGTALLLVIRASPPPPNSANTQIWWMKASSCIYLTDAQLDLWKSRGIGGFACSHSHLAGMGGSQDFTGDPKNPLTGSNYATQKAFKDTNVVNRAKARGLKMYLSFYAVNYSNCQTPLKEWFDDSGWSNTVVPKVRDIAAGAKLLGMAGLNIDQEMYAVSSSCNGSRPDWSKSGTVPPGGNIKAKVKQRGQEMMAAMLEVYPGIDLMFYDTAIPESWESEVQKVVNNKVVDGKWYIDFWDGMSSVEGYSNIRFQDAIFYKTTHINNNNWNVALQYNANRVYSYLSRNWSNWQYAAPRFSVTPFAWIDDDCKLEGAFAANRSSGSVLTQMDAFNKWGIDGQISNYTYSNNFQTKDYQDYYSSDCVSKVSGYDNNRPYNYLPAISKASELRNVDTVTPTLTINPAENNANKVSLSGTATDNFAIRYIAWSNDRGGSGVAKTNWKSNSGNINSGFDWFIQWDIDDIPLQNGPNIITITAHDIKGLSTTKTITVNANNNSPPPDPVEITQQPDLIVSAISRIPQEAKEGDKVQLVARIKNIGNLATTQGVVHDVLFNIDGKNIAWSDNHTTSIKPGESITVTANGGPVGNQSAPFWSAIKGSHIINARVNSCPKGCGPDRITNESDESNNSLEETFTVLEGLAPENSRSDTTPPSVSLTSPTAGSTVKDDVTFSANANDDVSVTRVVFKINNETINTDTTAPYSFIWNSKTKIDGAYTVTAVATDSSGNSTTSAGRVINVQNKSATPPPQAPATSYIKADINQDRRVNSGDLIRILQKWQLSVTNDPADINQDGKINSGDLIVILQNWQKEY